MRASLCDRHSALSSESGGIPDRIYAFLGRGCRDRLVLYLIGCRSLRLRLLPQAISGCKGSQKESGDDEQKTRALLGSLHRNGSTGEECRGRNGLTDRRYSSSGDRRVSSD